MSRYIELIFDNSASMDTELSPGRKRIDVAKELFRTEIAPTIGKMGDHITLRLLPENCEFASKTSVLSNHRNEMLQTIDSVKPERTSTALYKSVKEAADECAAKNAHEKIIFILTDGDDNCHSEMEWLIDNQTRQMIRQYNVLLVQLAVNDPVTQNNLASFSNYIGARSYSIGSEGRISNEAMRDDLRFALSDSGLNSELSVKPCLDFPLNYPMRSWDELQQEGFNMYKATLLHEEGFLSFKPEQNQLLKPIEFIELNFYTGCDSRALCHVK